ncbi:hypothetical protein OG979_27415 [Actinomadura citrea]|uniref:sirohydrochlorin chelatase n=1 Tax=Actinomadura citrea TaxID=46158 RepID=UPI002E28ADED|nr:hypothetical protein [Actinomadura citrea]
MSGGWRVVLVGGHESRQGGCLPELIGSGGAPVHAPGRDLQSALRPRHRLVAVPMTLGRDPDLPVVTAQTLRWAARDREPGDLLLAGPLGTTEHLVGWIRGAVTRTLRDLPGERAVLLVAPAAGPEPDADLFRVARLVWQYTPVRWVEVALSGGEPDVDEGVERCRRLGADDVVLVPASFVPAPRRADARTAGPLLGAASLAALIRQRAAEAERRWSRDGDDGLAPTAHGHGHGHAHEQGHEQDHGHLQEIPRRVMADMKGEESHVG